MEKRVIEKELEKGRGRGIWRNWEEQGNIVEKSERSYEKKSIGWMRKCLETWFGYEGNKIRRVKKAVGITVKCKVIIFMFYFKNK